MTDIITYMVPGLLWFIIREINSPLKIPLKRILFTIIVFGLLYPIIILLNYLSYLRMKRYLKPFKKWKFIFLREVELLKSEKERMVTSNKEIF